MQNHQNYVATSLKATVENRQAEKYRYMTKYPCLITCYLNTIYDNKDKSLLTCDKDCRNAYWKVAFLCVVLYSF